MRNLLETLFTALVVLAFAGLMTYGCIGAIAEHDQAYNLTDIKPVKIYKNDCDFDKSIGINVTKELCEAK